MDKNISSAEKIGLNIWGSLYKYIADFFAHGRVLLRVDDFSWMELNSTALSINFLR
jgi:hypothetical protein